MFRSLLESPGPGERHRWSPTWGHDSSGQSQGRGGVRAQLGEGGPGTAGQGGGQRAGQGQQERLGQEEGCAVTATAQGGTLWGVGGGTTRAFPATAPPHHSLHQGPDVPALNWAGT